ncbi:hypothetical protein KKC13_10345 [bacterium]|nr:hypothetical protein [bacterium]MBU1957414.1 hypothetical protein [bacterium]
MRLNLHSKIRERRKKRLITPALYFIAEMVFIFLVLSLIQLNFDIRDWATWSYIVLVIFGLYSLGKTIHVYQRQKSYE